MNASPPMRRSPAITIGLFAALLAATAWCFSTMLGQRFAGGEVYAPCSTQRSDPLGAKALFEAVDRLEGTTCGRNFKRLAKLTDTSTDAEGPQVSAAKKAQTLVILGVAAPALADGDVLDGDTLHGFAAAGGRVVLTLSARQDSLERVMQSAEDRQRELREERRRKQKDDSKDGAKEKAEKDGGKSGKPDRGKDGKQEDDLPFKPAKSVRQALGIAVKTGSLSTVPDEGHTLETPEGLAVLRGQLPRWFSDAALDLAPPAEPDDEGRDKDTSPKETATDAPPKPADNPPSPWKTLATADGKPVLAERRVGGGSVVIATDTYFATNQALLMHPVPEFLAWLIGDARHVIFDETHLGTQENPGIMTLARRFHLHGFFFGGILLFILFVWQSSSSLVPAQDGADSPVRTVAGQGAAAGLVSLLRRGVPRSKLLHTCFEQWERNHPHPGPAQQLRIQQAKALLPPADMKRPPRGFLVALYQRLSDALHPKRH